MSETAAAVIEGAAIEAEAIGAASAAAAGASVEIAAIAAERDVEIARIQAEALQEGNLAWRQETQASLDRHADALRAQAAAIEAAQAQMLQVSDLIASLSARLTLLEATAPPKEPPPKEPEPPLKEPEPKAPPAEAPGEKPARRRRWL